MKKYFLLSFFATASVFSFAQTVSFGIKTGVTSASMRGDAVSNLDGLLDYTNGMISTQSRTGVFAGTFASIPVSDAISIEPGLYYSQKGYSLAGEIGIKGAGFLGVNASAKLKTHYVDFPVLIKANLGGFQVFAGPQISYLAKADLQTRAGLLGLNLLNKTMDATSQFNRWDVAATGGVGYQFENGVGISASYDYGLSRVDANKSLNSYNRAVKVGLSYRF